MSGRGGCGRFKGPLVPKGSFQPPPKPLIDIAALGNGQDQDNQHVSLDGIADAPFSDPYAPDLVNASQFHGAVWVAVVCQRFDGLGKTSANGSFADASEVSFRRLGENDPVRQRSRSAFKSLRSTPPFA